MNNQWFSKIAVWLVIALVLFTVFKSFNTAQTQGARVAYSEFLEDVHNKHYSSVEITEGSGSVDITGKTTDGVIKHTTGSVLDRGLIKDLIDNGVKFDVKPREEQGMLTTLLLSWAPMLLLIAVWIFFIRRYSGRKSPQAKLVANSDLQVKATQELAAAAQRIAQALEKPQAGTPAA